MRKCERYQVVWHVLAQKQRAMGFSEHPPRVMNRRGYGDLAMDAESARVTVFGFDEVSRPNTSFV